MRVLPGRRRPQRTQIVDAPPAARCASGCHAANRSSIRVAYGTTVLGAPYSPACCHSHCSEMTSVVRSRA